MRAGIEGYPPNPTTAAGRARRMWRIAAIVPPPTLSGTSARPARPSPAGVAERTSLTSTSAGKPLEYLAPRASVLSPTRQPRLSISLRQRLRREHVPPGPARGQHQQGAVLPHRRTPSRSPMPP